jgi:4-amino-4-deoxy-L-arabinose transferase-like glycosyltransferase
VSTLSAPIEGQSSRLSVLRETALALGGFLVLTLVLRFGSFSRSVIDFDESFFLLMGRSLLRGEIPYTTLFDQSPLGGMALFAAIQAVLGQSVGAIRIATWLSAGLTSFLVYRLAERISGGAKAAGLLAGVLYAVFTLFNLGLAAHREMFLAPLVTFAILMVLPAQARPGPWRLLAAGLAMGCALQLKYMYIFECVAVALAATLRIAFEAPRPLRAVAADLIRAYALLAAPALLILAGEAGIFSFIGHWPEFALANFQSPASYVELRPYSLAYLVRRIIWQTRSNSLVWLGAAVTPFSILRTPDRVRRIQVAAVLAWFLLALASTVSTGRYWDHYYLQLVTPGSVLTGAVLAGLLNALPTGRRAERAVLLLFALAPLYALVYPPLLDTARALKVYASGLTPSPDGPVLASDYLRSRVRPGDAIYVADYEPLVYYLVDAIIPTRYAFPPHLTNPDFGRIGIPQLEEFRRVMDSRPRYVLKQSPPSNDMENPLLIEELASRLKHDYVLEQEIPARDSFSGRDITVQIFGLQQ